MTISFDTNVAKDLSLVIEILKFVTQNSEDIKEIIEKEVVKISEDKKEVSEDKKEASENKVEETKDEAKHIDDIYVESRNILIDISKMGKPGILDKAQEILESVGVKKLSLVQEEDLEKVYRGLKELYESSCDTQ